MVLAIRRWANGLRTPADAAIPARIISKFTYLNICARRGYNEALMGNQNHVSMSWWFFAPSCRSSWFIFNFVIFLWATDLSKSMETTSLRLPLKAGLVARVSWIKAHCSLLASITGPLALRSPAPTRFINYCYLNFCLCEHFSLPPFHALRATWSPLCKFVTMPGKRLSIHAYLHNKLIAREFTLYLFVLVGKLDV